MPAEGAGWPGHGGEAGVGAAWLEAGHHPGVGCTSQLSMPPPLGSTQSSKVLLVHVPVRVGRPREHTPGPAVQQASPGTPASSPGPWRAPGWASGHRLGPTGLTGARPRRVGARGPKPRAEPPPGEQPPQPASARPSSQVGRGGQGLTTLALRVVAEQAVGQPDGEGEAACRTRGAQLGDVNHVVDARLIHPQPELLV